MQRQSARPAQVKNERPTQLPEQRSQPVPLDPKLFQAVAGGLPKGTWAAAMLPKGTW